MLRNGLNRTHIGLLGLTFAVSLSLSACSPAEPPPKIDTDTTAKLPTVPSTKSVDPIK
jgi:hypothetical protein